MKEYRHEIKYLCTKRDWLVLRNKIELIANKDSHVINNSYLIRSIYFDDFDNSCFYDNESGVDPRRKWRIRSYNHDEHFINLECKEKLNGLIHKESTIITRNIFETLIKEDVDINNAIDFKSNNKLLNRFLLEKEMRLLKPAVIVEYRRFPYVYSEGNVRITFDTNIASSNDFEDFFDPNLKTRPIQSSNQELLEVKFDEFLPDVLNSVLQVSDSRQTSFSKYYLCRKYNMGV